IHHLFLPNLFEKYYPYYIYLLIYFISLYSYLTCSFGVYGTLMYMRVPFSLVESIFSSPLNISTLSFIPIIPNDDSLLSFGSNPSPLSLTDIAKFLLVISSFT